MNEIYQICNRCVLDTSEPSMIFDEFGVCQYCNNYDEFLTRESFNNSSIDISEQLATRINRIKSEGKGKEYDCIIGVSGGVDSSYVAYLVKEYGLRPLAVHLDNGWNDELAVKNIENICKILDIDLHTHVINWAEFKDLQLSFLKASVANAEAPTDHAIFATLFNLAQKVGTNYIIDGVNKATEFTRRGLRVTGYRYDDLKQIRGIHRRFGTQKLKTFPMMSVYKKFWLTKIRGIKQFSILDYVSFNKDEAKKFLIDKLQWKEYGAKHHESLFTKWHQVVYLREKFGFDKRRLHLSDLILSGQISRKIALEELSHEPLPSSQRRELEEYVAKKLSLSSEEYLALLRNNPVSYNNYPNDEWLLNLYFKTFKQ